MVRHLKSNTFLSSEFADDLEAHMRKGRGSMQQFRQSTQRERSKLWSRWLKNNPEQVAEWKQAVEFSWRTEDIPHE